MKRKLLVLVVFVGAMFALSIGVSAVAWNPGGPECVGADTVAHPDCIPSTTTGHTPVTICHHAGPNPADWHTITIDDSALQAHLAHGDTVGACEEQPPPTTTTTPTDTTPTETTSTTPPLGTTTTGETPKPPVEAGTTPKAEKAAKRAKAVASSPGNESLQVAQLGG